MGIPAKAGGVRRRGADRYQRNGVSVLGWRKSAGVLA